MASNETESDLRAAFATVGKVLYHHKGYFSICVVDFVVDDEGVAWVTFFNRNNAGTMYQKYDGTFMKQFDENQTIDPAHTVLESFYKENKVHACSVDRMLERSGSGGYKWTLTKLPHNPYQPRNIVTAHSGISVTSAAPTELAPPDPVESLPTTRRRKHK